MCSMPIGTVIAFAGVNGSDSPDPSQWLLCDGQQLSVDDPEYQELFQVIGVSNGGDGAPSFYLPDYRGVFLRGVDNGAGNDPNSTTRSQPQSGTGNSGDKVGSYQSYATAMPTGGSILSDNYDGLAPSGATHHHVSGSDADLGNSGSASTIAVGGGDSETRPINIYVDYYIKYANSTS